jgi:calcineurin-like phosphoesterase family protein
VIKEHDRVVLIVDLPENQLQAGNVGVVVMIHGDHVGYELEIFSTDGRTLGVVTVEAAQVRPISRHDILHARERTES